MCHYQEVQCKQTTLHSAPTLHCKGERSLEASCLCQLYFERILGEFIFVENCNLNDVVIVKYFKYSSPGIFLYLFELSSMSWNIGFSRNLVLKLQNKLVRFYIVFQEKFQKFSQTVLGSQSLPR